MTIDSFTFESVKDRLAKAAFVPTLVRVTDDPDSVDDETSLGRDDVRASKIGGAPFLSAESPWPRCGKCKQPMHFVFQLRRDDLPAVARASLADELLQLFWCDDCQSQGGSENPWSKGALVREIALGDPIAAPRGDDDEPLTVTFLRDFAEVVDHPSTLIRELAAALGVSPRSSAIREKLEELANEMIDAEIETVAGFKIGGHPRWVSEPETVKCTCKTPMVPFLQLGETVAVGDAGSTWIVGCPACGKKAYLCQQ